MKLPSLKQFAALTVLLGTITFFAYYFINHPEVGQRLKTTPLSVLAGILALYFASVVAIALITIATLKLCNISLERKESMKLTAYSSLVNFFGPLQSGPAFRAIYLKKKHGVSLKKFAAASLVYYLVFGVISLLFVASYWLDWHLGLLTLLGLIALYFVTRLRLVAEKLRIINLRGWYFLVAATVFQIIVMAAIYYLELRTVAPGTSLHQAIIYSGAANLALFVSLTPGAIGFRESFLVFSQHLHHISNATIVTANILDRAMYIVLLVILAIAIFATHTKHSLTTDEK